MFSSVFKNNVLRKIIVAQSYLYIAVKLPEKQLEKNSPYMRFWLRNLIAAFSVQKKNQQKWRNVVAFALRLKFIAFFVFIVLVHNYSKCGWVKKISPNVDLGIVNKIEKVKKKYIEACV